MSGRCCLIFLLGAALSCSSAAAQDSAERNPLYETARNKIGLLRYCRDKGLIDRATADDALLVDQHSLGTITPAGVPYNKAAGDEAEKRGEAGIYGVYVQYPIADAARLIYETTPEGACKGWVESSMIVLEALRLRGAEPQGLTSRTAQPRPQ